jgi:hypothetical protein
VAAAAIFNGQHDRQNRQLLRAQLLGSDTKWIAQLLDTKEISPGEVLASYDGTQPDTPVAELAKILVPRGIDPARIAALMLWGQYSGSFSTWYQSRIDLFTAMLQTDNPSVKAVATEGIEIFTRQSDQAAHTERLERIRGHA